MASVIFFRAANVGGHQTFQPAALARELAEFGVVNVGAAGTYVVRKMVSAAKLREEVWRRLLFKPDLMICRAREIMALADGKQFGKEPAGKGIQRFVSIMQKAPAKLPALPVEAPIGGKWEVRVVAVTGQFALSWRRPGPKGVYANAVVEKILGVPATTRNWNTIIAICDLLSK